MIHLIHHTPPFQWIQKQDNTVMDYKLLIKSLTEVNGTSYINCPHNITHTVIQVQLHSVTAVSKSLFEVP